ncbi:MAG: methyltransferase domain-containing protein [Rhodobacteraceae bacterium]|nr:methyltransferase domain-containing protein [Paracoccaceae bacterium]
MADAARIARYYNQNTRRFLAMGGSGAALAIHRPLWGPGVQDAAGAAGYVNEVIARLAEAALGGPPGTVRDLGCGVGGSMLHLAAKWPVARLDGVTLSATQAALGGAEAARRGLASRISLRHGDFLLPPSGRAELVLAIESHVHAPSARAFMAAAAAQLAPGGVLVVVDDMLASPEAEVSARGRARVSAFRRGWHLGHVPTPEQLQQEAARLGLARVARQDLTPLLGLDRFRDRALRLAGPLADALGLARWPIFANMIGGNALNAAYRAGEMRYVALAWRARE